MDLWEVRMPPVLFLEKLTSTRLWYTAVDHVALCNFSQNKVNIPNFKAFVWRSDKFFADFLICYPGTMFWFITHNIFNRVFQKNAWILLYCVTCKPCNGSTNCFFSWKLWSIHKFWIQKHFCTNLGSRDMCKTKWGFCDRLMW